MTIHCNKRSVNVVSLSVSQISSCPPSCDDVRCLNAMRRSEVKDVGTVTQRQATVDLLMIHQGDHLLLDCG